jgi:hypothetical protein
MSDNTGTKVVGEYYRSLNGDVIHLAPCSRMGKSAVRWDYANEMSLHEVAAEVSAVSWMRLGACCWPPAARVSGVQS